MISDIVSAARVLLACPKYSWPTLVQRLATEAHAAHHYSKRMNRRHPQFGDGSLFSRAALEPQQREPFASDKVFLQAVETVIAALLARK